jgi:hypothetical protein
MTQIFFHTYFQARINLHANNNSKMSTLKFVFHFTISLAAANNVLIYLGQRRQSNSSVGHRLTRVGQNAGGFLCTSDNFTNGSDNVRDRPIF